jgi:hypothetical protein
MRILTWNVNGIRSLPGGAASTLKQLECDILMIQVCCFSNLSQLVSCLRSIDALVTLWMQILHALMNTLRISRVPSRDVVRFFI